MSKARQLLAMALISAIEAENKSYGGKNEYNPFPAGEPEWKRKKCKSCKHFDKTWNNSKCSRNQNNAACKEYQKKNK
jgi:hypothetical protein